MGPAPTSLNEASEAIKGIIEEGQEIMEDFQESDALDAGLIAAGQAIEHYEMSRYGTCAPGHNSLGCAMWESSLTRRSRKRRKPISF
jgi:ferritin-like metal-binding protein YciE